MTSYNLAAGSPFPVTKAFRMLVLICLGVLAMGLTGCVSTDEYKRLDTAYQQSQRQLAKAEEEINRMRGQIAQLNARIAELTDLLDKNTNSMGALDALQARLADLQARYDDLLSKMNSQPVLPVGIINMLRDLAAQYPDFMEFDERTGMIRLKSDLTFDRGSTEVSARGKQVLALLAQILNKPEIARNEIQVSGHTDDIPITAGGQLAQRNPDNWTLSTNRAWSVLAVLRDAGVKQDRGMASGWGDQRPIAVNGAGKTGNVKNRRVDIYILPTQVPSDIVVSTPGNPATRPAPRPTPTPTTGPGGVPIPR